MANLARRGLLARSTGFAAGALAAQRGRAHQDEDDQAGLHAPVAPGVIGAALHERVRRPGISVSPSSMRAQISPASTMA